jgi:hypothetical protein
VSGRARRYQVDVAPFLALPSPPSAQDWRDAADLVSPGTLVAGRYGDAELPDGWRAVDAFDLVQMIGEGVTGADCAEAISLGAADVPEVLELVAQTEPGPFLKRTVELGDYLGIRRDGVSDPSAVRAVSIPASRTASSSGRWIWGSSVDKQEGPDKWVTALYILLEAVAGGLSTAGMFEICVCSALRRSDQGDTHVQRPSDSRCRARGLRSSTVHP